LILLGKGATPGKKNVKGKKGSSGLGAPSFLTRGKRKTRASTTAGQDKGQGSQTTLGGAIAAAAVKGRKRKKKKKKPRQSKGTAKVNNEATTSCPSDDDA
jgi:hypothetical protein